MCIEIYILRFNLNSRKVRNSKSFLSMIAEINLNLYTYIYI